MAPFLVAVYRYKASPRGDLAATERLARLLTGPALRVLSRTWHRVKDRDSDHEPATHDTVLEHLQDPRAHAVGLDSGRTGDLVATASIELALPYVPDGDIPAPMQAHIVIPYDSMAREDLVQTTVEIAEILRPAWGMVSVEATLGIAQNATLQKGPLKDERASYPLMTDDRIRYRRTPWYHDKKIDQAIGGPEWGTFLGPKHLEKLSLDVLRASSAFFEARPLQSGGAFLRLSEDPLDTQSPAILDLVARARQALAPITLDVSAVKL